MGSKGAEYCPSSFVSTVRTTTFWSVLVKVTVAFATGLFCASVTLPTIVPVISVAAVGRVERSQQAAIKPILSRICPPGSGLRLSRCRASSERITESSRVAPRRPGRRARFYVAPALRVKPRPDETTDSILGRRCWRRYDWPHSLQRAEPCDPAGSQTQLLASPRFSCEQPCLR